MTVDAQADAYACRQAGCQVAQTGRCLEGLSLNDCPHLFPRGDLPTVDTTELFPEDIGDMVVPRDDRDAESAAQVALTSGEDLTSEAASSITRRSMTQVILLAGAVGSGKTTLIASIYERFQEHQLAGYLFAGSRTLVGFEKRCHLARIASERARPDTERTLLAQGTRFLHLQTRREDLCGPIRDLLLTDLSGELFRRAGDSSEECRKLGVLLRADRLVLLIDGERLIDPRRRHQATLEPKMLLRRALDEGMLSQHVHVDVVFAKWDLMQDDAFGTTTAAFVETTTEEFSKRYGGCVRSLHFYHVAARPDATKRMPIGPDATKEMPIGVGLENLFDAWMADDGPKRRTVNDAPLFSGARREFDHYLWKRLPRPEPFAGR